ncbi:ROK family protein [Tessaracoccus sp. OS52]|uniref:ROK family protein n=1 Tax=Tessaracoccus sp. OS52 TaxID=2886691 RepID=UPI001D121BF9|nr:ROK family protein [Tessaracoccus sp. OS52]MCC2592014.1 ROK family protein [Tessaracoccus sp. OS52]
MTGLVAGVDIGGTKVGAVAVTSDGVVLASRTAVAARGGSAVLAQVSTLVAQLESDTAAPVVAVGVGAAGVIDSANGLVLAASETFQDWTGRAIGEELQQSLARPVKVANDVNAFLLGELRWGALVGVRSALGIMLGTGVGGAIVLDGIVLEGSHGGAGEIGHTPSYSSHRCTCGGTGHLETMASGRSLGLRYSERAGGAPPTGREVAQLARTGDPTALLVFEEAGLALANAILSASTLLDVGHVVVGGGVGGAWDVLGPTVERAIRANPPVTGRPLVIRPATLAYSAMGAASLVLGSGTRKPSEVPL